MHIRLFWFSFLICLLFLFYPGLIRSDVPAFRDAYHFYYPQAVWLDECASRGEYFPRWNSGEGLGSSVAGQTSSALYYPLRILWLIPELSVAQRFSAFILVHLLLSAWGIAFAARKLGLSSNAACVAAASYALSCPVFFQHTNLIFLTSAAWIGFVLGAIVEFCHSGRANASRESPSAGVSNSRTGYWRSCLIFSVATTLMLLGGDPHTAANAWIVAACTAVIAGAYPGITTRIFPAPSPPPFVGESTALTLWVRIFFSPAARSIGWFGFAAALFVASTAIQWIPTVRWSMHSSRLGQKVVTTAAQDQATTLHPLLALETGSTDPIRHSVYDFSISPWHIATTVWPTLGGNYLPTNSRIFSLMPAEGRMWIPSLYFGIVPLVLVLSALRWGAGRTSRWLLALALFALLASLGNYSPVWLVRELTDMIGLQQLSQGLPNDHVGSLYWMLTAVIPGYDSFRYPGKWTAWFVAACSLIAAVRLDDHTRTKALSTCVPALLWRTMVVLSVAILLAAIALYTWSVIGSGITAVQFPTKTRPDAWLGLPSVRSVAWTLAVASTVPLAVLAAASVCQRSWISRVKFLSLLEMTLVAICWTAWVAPPKSQELWYDLESGEPPFVWVDTSEANFMRDGRQEYETGFLTAQTDYQDTFLLGKLAQIPAVRNLAASQSITPNHNIRLRQWLARRDNLTHSQPELDRGLRALGITHRLVRNPESATFAWQKLVETRPLCELVSEPPEPTRQATIAWEWSSASELVLTIRSEQAMRLLVRQFNDGGWSATIENENLERQSLVLEASIAPFIEARIPRGASTVVLRRKWLW